MITDKASISTKNIDNSSLYIDDHNKPFYNGQEVFPKNFDIALEAINNQKIKGIGFKNYKKPIYLDIGESTDIQSLKDKYNLSDDTVKEALSLQGNISLVKGDKTRAKEAIENYLSYALHQDDNWSFWGSIGQGLFFKAKVNQETRQWQLIITKKDKKGNRLDSFKVDDGFDYLWKKNHRGHISIKPDNGQIKQICSDNSIFFRGADPMASTPKKKDIISGTQVVTEIDHLSLNEQLEIYKWITLTSGLSPWYIFSGSKSMHFHILLNQFESIDKLVYLRRLLCLLTTGDDALTRPSQPFRFPEFARVEKANYQTIERQGENHSYDEVLEGLKKCFDAKGLSFPDIESLGDDEWIVVSKVLRDSKNQKVDNIFEVLESQCLSPLQDGTFKELHAKALNKGNKSGKGVSSQKAKNNHHNGNSDRGDENVEAKIELLLDHIPPRVKGSGTYSDYRAIFSGVASVLGLNRAIDIAYTHSPEGGNWSQILESSIGDFSLGTVIHFAKTWRGFDPKTNKEWIRLNQDDLIEKAKSVPPLYDEPYREKQLLHLVYILGIKDDPKDPEYPDRDIQAQVFRAVQNYLGFERTLELALVNCPNKTREKWINILARSILNKKRVKHNIGYIINLTKRLTGWSPEDDQRWLDLNKEANKSEAIAKYLQWTKYTPDVTVSERHLLNAITDIELGINNIEFDNLIYSIKSIKGTGKTTFLEWFVDSYLRGENDRPILVICNRLNLIAQLAKVFGLTSVDSFLDSRGLLDGAIASNQNLSVCIDSLWRLKDKDLNNYIVIIDESNQCFESLHLSETEIKNKRDLVYSTLADISKQCQSMILLDADQNDLVNNYFSSISGKPVRSLLNTHNPWDRKLTYFTGRGSLEAFKSNFYQDTMDGKKICFVTDCKKEVKAMYEVLKLILGDKVVLLTPEDIKKTKDYSPEKRVTRFIDNKGKALIDENIYILLATPCIQSGISIEVGDHFDYVYGYFVGAFSPNDASQIIARVRSNCPRKVYFNSRAVGYMDYRFDHEQILKDDAIYQDMVRTEAKHIESLDNMELSEAQKSEILKVFLSPNELTKINLEYQAILRAKNNIQRCFWGDIFLDILKSEGYALDTDYTLKINSFYKSVKDMRKELLEQFAQKILDAPLIKEDTAIRYKMQNALTEDESAQLTKYYFNVRYPELVENLTFEFVLDELLKNNSKVLQGIENYYYGLNPEIAINKSINKFYSALKRSHKSKIFLNQKKGRVLEARLFNLIGGEDFFSCSWVDDEGFTNNEAKTLIKGWSRAIKHILKALGISYSNKSCFTKVIKKIAELYGHTIEPVAHVTPEGSKKPVTEDDPQRYRFIPNDHWDKDPMLVIDREIAKELGQETTGKGFSWHDVLYSLDKRYSEKIKVNKDILDDITPPEKYQENEQKSPPVCIDYGYIKSSFTPKGYNPYPVRVQGVSNFCNSESVDHDSQTDNFLNLNNEKIDLFSTNNNSDLSSNSANNPEKAIAPDDYPLQNEQSLSPEVKPPNLAPSVVQKSKVAIGQVIRYVVERWNGKTYIKTHVNQGVIKSIYGDSVEVDSGGQSSWIRQSAILDVVQ